ncbi:MAG: hypothetical protein E7225_01235 [Clostridiales bacterium]|nr:hypothetical protein [Clostridiales bacterium]
MLISFVDKEISRTKARIKANRREFKKMPDGHVRRVARRNKYEFLHVSTDDNGKRIRKGITKDKTTIKRLARKEFLEKEIKVLEANLKALRNFKGNYIANCEKTAMSLVNKNIRSLPEDFFKTTDIGSGVMKRKDENENITTGELIRLWNSDERYLLENIDIQKRWENSPYEKSTYMENELKHMTAKGFKVRSKSEVLLTGILDNINRPLHYEEVIRINGRVFVPDFTVLDVHGKVIFIEHFGRTFDPEYMKRRREKLEAYEQAGIVPWDNFIATYDDEDGNIDINAITAELKAKLLY